MLWVPSAFKSIVVYNLLTKSDFCSECLHYIMGYITNWGFMFFLFSLVLNLVYIGYSLCQSVYMQYLRCCDHSNKCFFLVIQQAQVLLNIFGECMYKSELALFLFGCSFAGDIWNIGKGLSLKGPLYLPSLSSFSISSLVTSEFWSTEWWFLTRYFLHPFHNAK